jgi:hypothetical protein
MCNFVSTEKIEAQIFFPTYQTNMTDNQTNLTDNQANMPDNQEHDETLECCTYVQKDGETISVSKATHNNVYDVVRYLVKEKQLTQPIDWGTSDFKKAQAFIRKRKQREKELEEADGEEPEQILPGRARLFPPPPPHPPPRAQL